MTCEFLGRREGTKGHEEKACHKGAKGTKGHKEEVCHKDAKGTKGHKGKSVLRNL